MHFKEQKKLKAITFSFDDGITQDIRMVELMNQYNLKCTFNLNSERLATKGILNRNGLRIARYTIHPTDVSSVYEGHEVAVHTLTHPNLTTLEEAEVIRQVEQDRLNLSELAGYEVVGMAYPCGGVNNDDRTAEIIRNHTGVKYCRTISCNRSFDPQENLYRFNPTAHTTDFDNLMRLGQQFVELDPARAQIFYIWGHSYEMDYSPDNWIRLEEFFRLISNKDDIFYGTNKEVLL